MGSPPSRENSRDAPCGCPIRTRLRMVENYPLLSPRAGASPRPYPTTNGSDPYRGGAGGCARPGSWERRGKHLRQENAATAQFAAIQIVDSVESGIERVNSRMHGHFALSG